MAIIKLKSFDDVIFEVDYEVAMRFGVINEMFKNMPIHQVDKKIVELPYVYAEILKIIIDWAIYHKDDPPVPPEGVSFEQQNEELPPWEEAFLNAHQRNLSNILIAANYLNIPDLMANVSKLIGKLIEGKSTEEIRMMFEMDDFSPADLER